MKVRVAAVLAAAMSAVLAAGCSNSAPAPNSTAVGASAAIPLLRMGLASSFPNLDLAKTINANSVDVLSLDTLMKFGPQGQVEPNLATSVTKPDPVTYVYHLRHGVTFWNGDPLTAADVAYSMNHDRAPGSQVGFSYTSVKSITATGPYTVTVTLTHPDATWQYTAAEYNSAIFEKKFAQAHQGTFGGPQTLIMGSGPWQVDSFDPTKGAELSANPHWWGGRVPIAHISMAFFSGATSEALAFRAGNIDLAPDISQPQTFAATSGARRLCPQPGGHHRRGRRVRHADLHADPAGTAALGRVAGADQRPAELAAPVPLRPGQGQAGASGVGVPARVHRADLGVQLERCREHQPGHRG
jgi:peptide/nickel transport system substrate-binding protein